MTPDPALVDGPIVVDANVLFGALVSDGAARHLLLYSDLDLHTPDHIWDELDRNRETLLEKTHATPAAFELLLDALDARIADLPPQVLRAHLDEALDSLSEADRLDAPYVAAALAVEGALWTQDKRLREQAPIPVLSTADIVDARGLP